MNWGYVYSFASIGNHLFAGEPSFGIFATTDNGSNWTNPAGPSAKALVANGNILFAGDRFNVYKSTDFGATWSGTGIPSAQPYIMALATDGNNVFAGAEAGPLFLSTNNGGNWTHLLLNNAPVASILIVGNKVLFGTWFQGVISSTNNGVNWVQTSLDTQSVYSLAINGTDLFAGTNRGVYKSVNNGANWTQTSLNNVMVYSLAISGSNIFAGTYFQGVYISNDNGVTWSQRNEGLGNFQVNALSILNNFVFAGTFGDSVYKRPLSELIGIQSISEQVPSHFSLSQNYPNPFNPTTKFKIEIAKSSFTKVTVFDVLGREVATLVNQQLQPGTYEVNWDASNYPSGVYYYKLVSGIFTETKKMILIK